MNQNHVFKTIAYFWLGTVVITHKSIISDNLKQDSSFPLYRGAQLLVVNNYSALVIEISTCFLVSFCWVCAPT